MSVASFIPSLKLIVARRRHFEVFVAVTSLVLGIVFSCGICPCGCFRKAANPDGGADHQVPVVVATPVAEQAGQPDAECKQETQA